MTMRRSTATLKRRRRVSLQRKIICTLSIISALSLGSFLSLYSQAADSSVAVTPEENLPRIERVFIRANDSLWRIAEKYNTDEHVSTSEYIQKIKKMNNLSSDVIYAGRYLILEL